MSGMLDACCYVEKRLVMSATERFERIDVLLRCKSQIRTRQRVHSPVRHDFLSTNTGKAMANHPNAADSMTGTLNGMQSRFRIPMELGPPSVHR